VSIIWVVPGIIWTVILVPEPPLHPATKTIAAQTNPRKNDPDMSHDRPIPFRGLVLFLPAELPVIRAYDFEVLISPFRMTSLGTPALG
jgi:hypothetical protein